MSQLESLEKLRNGEAQNWSIAIDVQTNVITIEWN